MKSATNELNPDSKDQIMVFKLEFGKSEVKLKIMKPPRKYMIAIGVVTLWAVFSYAYLTVEDGSSGLSILGLIHALFLIPGVLLFHTVKDSHSNANIPLMEGISWFVYVLVVLLMVKCVCVFRKIMSKSKPDDGNNI